ncbi:two-component regulator propeller domain-containing protein [Hymenobacter sp. HDW8]|uniref:type IX secretion system anionic LPS delivery protein PorZ n=1 Tax=Hymenobacter sp. HDW8 TaxID=2714932 RepID=UPI0014090B47|nr:two-component regulator propeller domain-containing protein [Hymenobacter sp. HDW8]QIL76965.1 T9SS type A sorting domain-containing protein [Hymenobacter sp. HDW8]
MTYLLRTCRWLSFFAIWLCGLTSAVAQGPVGFGDWQLHLPTNQAKAVTDADKRVYVATENSFFYFDKELNTTRLLSRRDGLNDVGVSTVAYDSVSQQLLVAYNSGNLDVLRANGSIQNVTDILRAQITQAKTVNHINFSGPRAYLACSFGLVVLDMTRLEVRDTYVNIGPAGQAVQVYASAVLRDSVYAATSAGLLRGRLTDNLANFRSWTIDLPARAGNPFRTLTTYNEKVYAGANGDQLYRFVGGTGAGRGWQPVAGFAGGQFRQLTASRAGLLVVGLDNLAVLDRPGGTIRTYRNGVLRDTRAAIRARDGAFYVADFQNGLVKTTGAQQFENFVSNAPASARSFSVYSDARTGITDVFSGGFSDRFLQNGSFGGFYEYKDGQWTNITPQTLPNRSEYPNFQDPSHGVRTPDGTLYIGSYGNGILEWKGPGSFRQFTDGSGSNPLKTALAPPKFPNFDPNYTRITDLTADAEGNVWVVNRHEFAGVPGVHIFNPVATTWRSLPYFAGVENLNGIVLDNNGYVWLSTSRQPTGNGVIAYDETTRTPRYFSTANGLPSNDIYDMVKDRQGSIWVATSTGVAVLTDPSQTFLANSEAVFQKPFIQRGPQASLNFPALNSDIVRCVAVDGANRKWFGTDRGLWLFTESVDEALLNFTTDNSPLPSNRILDVAVNDRTGEVFVVTNAGVVSYRGSATVTEGKPACAKVFPNPVRTDFTGQVGISGLANNAVIKITDVTGKLVYQTRANGGTLTWNLADYNGRKVQSGVYMVLSSDADGKNTCISKIAVVAR